MRDQRHHAVNLCLMAGFLLGINGIAHARGLSVETFREDILLSRFDEDGDGSLNDRERARLREAFGGIDVPMFPVQPYDYLSGQMPAHSDPYEFRLADNTPPENPLTNEGAALGRVLFYDTQLSQNNTVACASCHRQQAAFSDPRQFSVGFTGQTTPRNSMSLVNLRYSNLRGSRPGFFWDERAATLEEQALIPIQDKVEMGMELEALEARLQELPYYPPLFEAAFGSPQVTSENIAKAIAQFLRSIVSLDSKFDRAAAKESLGNYSAPFAAFTDQENLGKRLFIDGVRDIAELGCAVCHLPPTFAMPKAFNNGLDRKYKDPGLGALDREPNDPFTPSNDGKFKAPSLRNIELTAPYMHDGRFQTLEQVMDHYSSGVHAHENLGLLIDEPDGDATSGLNLTEQQKAALAAFLKTLTDETVPTDPRFADPFVRLDN